MYLEDFKYNYILSEIFTMKFLILMFCGLFAVSIVSAQDWDLPQVTQDSTLGIELETPVIVPCDQPLRDSFKGGVDWIVDKGQKVRRGARLVVDRNIQRGHRVYDRTRGAVKNTASRVKNAVQNARARVQNRRAIFRARFGH